MIWIDLLYNISNKSAKEFWGSCELAISFLLLMTKKTQSYEMHIIYQTVAVTMVLTCTIGESVTI